MILAKYQDETHFILSQREYYPMKPYSTSILQEALFPVETRPIYLVQSQEKRDQPPSFDDFDRETNQENPIKKEPVDYQKIPHYKAVVDVERKHVFSVVSAGYHLVKNEEAISLGKKCFQTVFSQSTETGMQVYNVIMPKTRSFCHIDFLHEEGGFTLYSIDRWVPFLRVTNSYNRTKPLRFDLGFCRSICKNGVIFNKQSITFRYLHTNDEIAQTAKFNVSTTDLKNLETQFIARLHHLKQYHIPPELMFPLLCRVFRIQFTEDIQEHPKRVKQLLDFQERVRTLTQQYFAEIGPNGYAAFNVMTDFASRPFKLFISPEAQIDTLQKRSGAWIDRFIHEIENPAFQLDSYLADYTKQQHYLRN